MFKISVLSSFSARLFTFRYFALLLNYSKFVMSYIDIFRKNSYHCYITNEKTNEENYICSYGAGGNFDFTIFGWVH